MADTPTWAEVIRAAIDSRLLDVHVALPGRIESYDKDTQKANVKPLIKRVIRTRKGTPIEESLPVIPSIPVQFPGGSGFFISFPLSPGDEGMIIFCESDLDRWLETGNDVNPGDQRRHTLTGAVFQPGLRSNGNALSDVSATNIALGKDGGFVLHVTQSDIELPAGSSTFLTRDDRLQAELVKIKAALDAIAAAVPTSNPYVTIGATASNQVKGT